MRLLADVQSWDFLKYVEYCEAAQGIELQKIHWRGDKMPQRGATDDGSSCLNCLGPPEALSKYRFFPSPGGKHRGGRQTGMLKERAVFPGPSIGPGQRLHMVLPTGRTFIGPA
ncbi:MAG: hypothetical protein KDA64_03210 [Rhodospirillaceae bacterium]|nr:hypothetical protein [Rhodospirillaceae bacterium]